MRVALLGIVVGLSGCQQLKPFDDRAPATPEAPLAPFPQAAVPTEVREVRDLALECCQGDLGCEDQPDCGES